MNEWILEGAFAAWQIAQDKLAESWNHRADPANITPSVPRTMRRAADLIREHASGVIPLERQDQLLAIIENPWPERVLRDVRSVVGADEPAAERVRWLDDLIRSLGLEPPPPPVPLPEITHDDIHLVCWMAIVATDSDSSGGEVDGFTLQQAPHQPPPVEAGS
jgi:hypothetical protein